MGFMGKVLKCPEKPVNRKQPLSSRRAEKENTKYKEEISGSS